MQPNKEVLLKQKKRLEQELLIEGDELPKHRKTEVEALLYLIDIQLRYQGGLNEQRKTQRRI